MANAAILAIKIIADAASAQKGLEATAGSVEKAQKSLGKLAAPAAIALTGIVALGGAAIKSASDQQQAFGALEAVYGKNAAQVKKLAKGAATEVGLAASDYANLAALLGAQLKGMGTAADQLVPKTDALIKVGADLAATYGGTTADAVDAVSSLLRGERDPIEKYGIQINQAAIDAELAAKGLGNLTGAAKTQAQAQATLTLLTKQSADAHGQFARETDSAAGSSQVAAAQFENTKAALGTALLPVVATAMGMLGQLAGLFGDNTVVLQVLIGVIAALAVGILVANAALKAMTIAEAILGVTTEATTGLTIAQRVALIATTAAQKVAAVATKAWAAAQVLINVALTANPIGLVVAAIALLIAGLVLAYQHSETFRRIVTAAFGAVKDAASAALGWISDNWRRIADLLTAPIKDAWAIISAIFNKIQDAISAITSAVKKIPHPKLPDLNPFTAAAPAGPAPVAGPLTRGLTAGGTARTSSPGPTIVINGALDPEGVARQVRRILGGHDVRMGRAATVSGSL